MRPQCIVYTAYAFLIIYIDKKAQPDADAAYPGGDDDYYYNTAPYHEAVETLNNLYLASAIIHLVNAFMFIWSWLPLGFSIFSVVMIPEWLNVVGACLYLYTATLYPKVDGTYTDDATFQIHHAETAAASIELVAAVGWAITWWLTYPRGPGRGWTLDDPDVWANILIFVPSVYYVVYNAQVLADPPSYCCNFLYTEGNLIYAIGSIFYLLAALRDDGWFMCMPAGGKCRYGIDERTILDPLGTLNKYPSRRTAEVLRATGRAPRMYLFGVPPLSQWPCFAPCVRGGSSGRVAPPAAATLSFGERVSMWWARNCSCGRKAEAQSLLR